MQRRHSSNPRLFRGFGEQNEIKRNPIRKHVIIKGLNKHPNDCPDAKFLPHACRKIDDSEH